jgi:transcriptional regulator with XRE-family HTH domain
MAITEQLKKAIQMSGLTRYEISKRSGVEQSALSRFVTGGRSLTLPAVDAICKTLGLKLTGRAKRGK